MDLDDTKVTDEAWLRLLYDHTIPQAQCNSGQEQQGSSSSAVSEWLQRFCKAYPTSPLVSKAIEGLLELKERKRAQTILGEIVMSSPWIEVWQAYFSFLEGEGKPVTVDLVTRCLRVAGRDPLAGPIWRHRIALSASDSTEQGVQVVRGLYQQAIGIPLFEGSKIWDDYLRFEKEAAGTAAVELDEILSKKFAAAQKAIQLYAEHHLDRIAALPRKFVPRSAAEDFASQLSSRPLYATPWRRQTVEGSILPHYTEELTHWKSYGAALVELLFPVASVQWQGMFPLAPTFDLSSDSSLKKSTATPGVGEEGQRRIALVAEGFTAEDAFAVVDSHYRRLTALFPQFDVTWGDYALMITYLHPSLATGVELALNIIRQSISKYCPWSGLLHVLNAELRTFAEDRNLQFAKPLPPLSVADLQAAELVDPYFSLEAFAACPKLLAAHKAEFRSIGKRATGKGYPFWGFYQRWIDIERMLLKDKTLIKEIVTRGSSKMEPGSVEQAISIVAAQRNAVLAGDDSMLHLLEASVQPVSVGVTAEGGTAPVGTYTSLAGYRRSCWERFYQYEKFMNGPNSARLQAATTRSLKELEVGVTLLPSTSQRFLRSLKDHSLSLLFPADDERIEFHIHAELMAELRRRKEMEVRGEFLSPYKNQNIDFISAIYPPAMSYTASPESEPALAAPTSVYRPFQFPVNPHPSLPSDDPHSIIPCGLRSMKGALAKKLTLDAAAVRRQQREDERKKRELDADTIVKNRLQGYGVPTQVALILDRLPTLEDLHQHLARYPSTSAAISAARLVDKVNAEWLVQQLTTKPLSLPRMKEKQ